MSGGSIVSVEIPPDSARQNVQRKALQTSENDQRSWVEFLVEFLSKLLLIVTFPISIFFCFRVVTEYQRAVIFRMGRLRPGGARGPGMFFILPCIDEYNNVDLRTVSFSVPKQAVLTKDAVTVQVDAVVYYRINEPLKAVIQVSDYTESTHLLAATTLRNVIGTHSLAEVLSTRDSLAYSMQRTLDEATTSWGVEVERVEIKDVMLPEQLQRAMAAEAEAAREARAKIIAAEGEMKASNALKQASDILATSPSALQLRYLQTLHAISAEKSTTVIFPLPLEIIGPFLAKYQNNASSSNANQQQQTNQMLNVLE